MIEAWTPLPRPIYARPSEFYGDASKEYVLVFYRFDETEGLIYMTAEGITHEATDLETCRIPGSS